MFKFFNWLKYNRYLIRIIYKSGQHVDFWVYRFTAYGAGVKWIPIRNNTQPLYLNYDEVESIFQLKAHRGLYGDKKYDNE